MKSRLLALSVGIALFAIPVLYLPQAPTALATSLVSEAAYVKRTNLRDTLTSGLRATRPDEKMLINRVVGYVEQGKLPEKVVYGAFRWARKRHPEHPFPYFSQAIRVLAKRYGLVL